MTSSERISCLVHHDICNDLNPIDVLSGFQWW